MNRSAMLHDPGQLTDGAVGGGSSMVLPPTRNPAHDQKISTRQNFE